MATLELPPTDNALASQVAVILTTPPAAANGIPTLTEINAGLFAQCYLYARVGATPNQATGEGKRKLGSRRTPTKLGQVTYEAIELQYSYKPQMLGTPGHPGNKLYEALEPGATVTVALFDALPGDTTSAITASAVTDVYRCTNGVRAKGVTGDTEFDDLAVTQKLVIEDGGPIAEDHVLA